MKVRVELEIDFDEELYEVYCILNIARNMGSKKEICEVIKSGICRMSKEKVMILVKNALYMITRLYPYLNVTVVNEIE